MSFSDLKKQSSLGSLTQKLVKEVEKMNNSGVGADERLWKPELDKTGNGFAVIRFLPAPEGEDIPWAKMYSHAFQGPGGWYIENSLTTTGGKDPVSDYNRELWNSGNESDKDVVRKQKRKLSYYSNIYVVKDQLHPENEGKVFLYKYGKKIHDKIASAMQPQFEDETPINPFDLWKGANFKIKIQTIGGYWNYDKSEFDSPSVLGGLEDDALEAVWKSQHSLKEFTDLKNFKSYEELSARLNIVLNKSTRPVVQSNEEDEELAPLTSPVVKADPPTPTKSGFGAKIEEIKEAGESPDLSYFASLANED